MSGGTRPDPRGYFLYDRGLRLAAGLAVVVAIPVAVYLAALWVLVVRRAHVAFALAIAAILGAIAAPAPTKAVTTTTQKKTPRVEVSREFATASAPFGTGRAKSAPTYPSDAPTPARIPAFINGFMRGGS